MKISNKLKKLKEILKNYNGVVVAFSGGVDSTLLLKVARDVLRERVIAVTAISPLYPEKETIIAKRIARLLKVKHLTINSEELRNKNFIKNSMRRCYYCKIELFKKLKVIAQRYNYKVIEGSNRSDLGDYRPGLGAGRELGVDSPLIKAGLKKEEIRILAKKFKLPNWNKPSMACLASRIPYYQRIESNALKRIAKGEDFLMKLGLSQTRLRDHFPLARIEVPEDELKLVLKGRDRIVRYLKKFGYHYVTLDLEGYRTGSMNIK